MGFFGFLILFNLLLFVVVIGVAYFKYFNKLKNEYSEEKMNELYNRFIEEAITEGYKYSFSEPMTIALNKATEDRKRAISINIFQGGESKVVLSYKLFRHSWSPLVKVNLQPSEITRHLFLEINNHYKSILV